MLAQLTSVYLRFVRKAFCYKHIARVCVITLTLDSEIDFGGIENDWCSP